ncbi:uncharacterized protein BO80DRAFT_428028 [Aspergillus ibericus CBS 121593]|uniref:Uncharacterized protein n=1 Tax=Aspergillus ibericus CBS 121593 TaxID=1448316 RepID=A0A395GQH5_9EURO|nr:hypothetical protein BO80DRAFT_428028 [Aspergillus ibericus CBS 121593]RAK97765.1 hypothetical protein BO80DRAFT_428028 [Aspergillus ibericus CBS 121593]
MTATDDQGAKRGAVACLQGDALQHCRAITCRCINVGSDISGAIPIPLLRTWAMSASHDCRR